MRVKSFFHNNIFWALVGLWTILALSLYQSPASAADKSARRKVGLEWEPVEGATGYEVQIFRLSRKGKKKPILFTVKKAKWTGRVPAGTYEMKLRSLDHRGVPGDWSPASQFEVKLPSPFLISPKKKAQIATQELEEASVTMTWTPLDGAESYVLEVESETKEPTKKVETKETSVTLDLPVALSYRWRVLAVSANGQKGESPESWSPFTLVGKRLDPPEITQPLSEYVTEIQWNQPEKTKSFSYFLYRQGKGKKWKLIDRKKQQPASVAAFKSKYPPGHYRIKVKGHAPLYRSSNYSQITFHSKGGFRSPAAIEQAKLRDSLEKPTYFYAIASYFVTQMQYTTDNREKGRRAQFNTLGGTGRVGLGYQPPQSSWGVFGVIDMSGFNINGQNFTFAASEMHATWKKYLFKTHQLKLSGGAYLKELPDVLENDNVRGQFEGVGKITLMGPHFGLLYWMPLSQRFGLQLNTRAYYALIGGGANGEENSPSLSYQAGMLGSYRFNSNWTGFAGYAYRMDKGAYEAIGREKNSQSWANPGDISTVEVQGHYLNLILEYSF